MADKKISYEITGDPDNLLSAQGKTIEGFKKMGDQASESAGKINSAFGSMHSQTAGKINDLSKSANGLVDNVLKASNVIGFLGTALAGLSFVNKIHDQIEYADKLNKTSQKAGVTVETMSSLSYAAKLADVEMDSLSGGIGKLSKNIVDASTGGKEATATFAALKISIKDANGEIRPTEAIVLDLAERFAGMQDGATKTALAIRVFGKAGADLIPFLNQGKDGIEALQKEAERFGIVISTQTARAAEEFNDNLTRLQSAGQGLGIKLAGEVLPTLVAFTAGLVDARKAAIGFSDATKNAATDTSFVDFLDDAAMGAARLGDILKLIPSLTMAVASSFKVVWADASSMGKMAVELGKIPYRATLGTDGKALLEPMREIIEERNRVVEAANKKYDDLWNRPANNMEKYVGQSIDGLRAQRDWAKNADPRDAEVMRAHQKDDGKASFTPDMGVLAKANKADSSRVPEWQNQLEKEKLALREKNALEGTDVQFSLEREAQFWQKKIALTDSGSNERFSVEHKYFDAQEKISRESFASQIAAQKTAMADQQKNYEGALVIAENIAAQVKARYGADSKEYANAQRDVINVQRQFHEQRQQLLEIDVSEQRSALEQGLNLQQENARLQYELGGMTHEQLLQQELLYQQKMADIARQALEQKKALIDPTKDPLAAAQVNEKLLEQERSFQVARNRLVNEITTEKAKPMSNVFSTMEQQGVAFFNNTLTRANSWKSQMGSAFSSLGLSFVQEAVTKPMMAWIMKESGMTAATTAGVAIRSAADIGGAAVSTATTATTATTNITTSAYETAANVYKSIAAIPYVGPFLAPAMAIAATGTVLALVGKIASASGGYDIPAGVNPLVQAHAEEMILPAKYANGFRNIIEAGGSGGGGGGGSGGQVIYNDHSGRLTPTEIKRNAGIIASALKDFSKRS